MKFYNTIHLMVEFNSNHFMLIQKMVTLLNLKMPTCKQYMRKKRLKYGVGKILKHLKKFIEKIL